MLVTHPKVMDAAVFGIPDDEMGQRVKGVVQTVDPADATDEFAEELLAWLRDRLAHYKCPRSISFEAAAAAHRHRQAVQADADREVLDPGRLSPMGTVNRRTASGWRGRRRLGVTVRYGAATFTLVERACDDRRAITVAVGVRRRSPSSTERCARWPQAAAVCDDVLRSVDVEAPAFAGVITESLAYSTLQSGPEFARWLAERGPAMVPDLPDPVVAERDRGRAARALQPRRSATTRSPPMPGRRCSRHSRSHCSTRR